MTGNNPVDRSKFDTKRHILTEKKGIPFIYYCNISNKYSRYKSSNKDVIDNAVVLNR